ncbi:MAG: hypothetical protein R3C56_10670 [Pirellulaceae bacterium]
MGLWRVAGAIVQSDDLGPIGFGGFGLRRELRNRGLQSMRRRIDHCAAIVQSARSPFAGICALIPSRTVLVPEQYDVAG